MESNSGDYILIKKSFEDAMCLYEFRNTIVKIENIYRVKQRISGEASHQKSDNKLLFHGTNLSAVVGILEQGFRQSKGGKFGPGVYLTASPSCAHSYSLGRTGIEGLISYGMQSNYGEKPNIFLNVLVNEVLESKKLEVVKCQPNKSYTSRENSFQKFIVKKAPENDSDETHEEDSSGRHIRTSAPKQRDDFNHYVCHEHMLIPRYLIEYHSQVSWKF